MAILILIEIKCETIYCDWIDSEGYIKWIETLRIEISIILDWKSYHYWLIINIFKNEINKWRPWNQIVHEPGIFNR